MRIAVDARTLGSRPSGVGMYLNDFLLELMKYPEFEWVLLTDVAESDNIKHFEEQGIRVLKMGKPVYKSAGVYNYFNWVKLCLEEIKPDIFWEVNTNIPIKPKGDFKVMITIHDMFPIDYVQYFGKIYSLYFKHYLKKTLKFTDMILYNSEQTRKTTERIFPQARQIACCNGYIISNPLKKKPVIKDEGYFLYVGNMEKRKGVDLLLKSYVRYKEKGGKKPLVLAGKMQEDDIKALLKETKTKVDGITYLNYVKPAKKEELYSKCSCYLFPSKAEGFGMPVLELMKFNKPIIVSNLPIFDEIVGDCVNRFELNTTENGQIENLSDAMLYYNSLVDTREYKKVLARYSPDKLGLVVSEFIEICTGMVKITDKRKKEEAQHIE